MSPQALVNIYFTLLTDAYHIAHNVPLHQHCTPHVDPTLLHMQVKATTSCNFQLPCYNCTCFNNKYAPQMPLICHMKITSYADTTQL